eukprot:1694838-Pyramimonas_sp.AAC.1
MYARLQGAVGRIIGKAGANVRALTEETGCQVDIAKQVLGVHVRDACARRVGNSSGLLERYPSLQQI